MPGLTPIYTKIRGKVASSHEYTCPSLLRNLVAGYAGIGLVHVRAEEVSGEEEEEIFLFRIFFFFFDPDHTFGQGPYMATNPWRYCLILIPLRRASLGKS